MIYLYALRCPIAKSIRYIGKTKDVEMRLAKHISKAKSKQTNHHCARWIRKLLAQGHEPTLQVLRVIADGEDWQSAEQQCIAEHLAAGHPLTNMTAGGDGFHDVHPEVLAKRVAARNETLKDPIVRARFSAATAAARKHPRVRELMSAGVRNAWRDPDKRKRMTAWTKDADVMKRHSNAVRIAQADPAYKAKLSATTKRIWSTPERRAEASARALAMHANVEQNSRRLASIKAAYKRPETKEKWAAAMAEVYARPAFKAAKSATMKAAWTDPDFHGKVHSKISRAKRSEKMKERWQDKRDMMVQSMNKPERVAKLSASMTARNADPAFRAKINDPEVRARAAATLKATWARRKAEKQTDEAA